MQLELDLIYGFNSFVSLKNTKTPSSLARNKKRGNLSLINAFYNFSKLN